MGQANPLLHGHSPTAAQVPQERKELCQGQRTCSASGTHRHASLLLTSSRSLQPALSTFPEEGKAEQLSQPSSPSYSSFSFPGSKRSDLLRSRRGACGGVRTDPPALPRATLKPCSPSHALSELLCIPKKTPSERQRGRVPPPRHWEQGDVLPLEAWRFLTHPPKLFWGKGREKKRSLQPARSAAVLRRPNAAGSS